MTFCIICRIVVEDFVCHISQCEYALGQQPSLGHVTKPALSGQGSSKQMSYYAIALRRAGLKHFFFHCSKLGIMVQYWPFLGLFL